MHPAPGWGDGDPIVSRVLVGVTGAEMMAGVGSLANSAQVVVRLTLVCCAWLTAVNVR